MQSEHRFWSSLGLKEFIFSLIINLSALFECLFFFFQLASAKPSLLGALNKSAHISRTGSDVSTQSAHCECYTSRFTSSIIHPSSSSIIHYPSIIIIYHPSSIIHHQSSIIIIYHPLSIIHHQSSIIHYKSSIINHPLSIINHQSPIINHPSSIINHPSSIIHYPL